MYCVRVRVHVRVCLCVSRHGCLEVQKHFSYKPIKYFLTKENKNKKVKVPQYRDTHRAHKGPHTN